MIRQHIKVWSQCYVINLKLNLSLKSSSDKLTIELMQSEEHSWKMLESFSLHKFISIIVVLFYSFCGIVKVILSFCILQMVRTTSNGVVKTNGTHETNAVNDSYTFVKPTAVKNKENAVPVAARVIGVGSVVMGKGAPGSPRTITNGVGAEKPAKPEKPERRLNSRELIEKQKNWTSHFSKTRTSPRYILLAIFLHYFPHILLYFGFVALETVRDRCCSNMPSFNYLIENFELSFNFFR